MADDQPLVPRQLSRAGSLSREELERQYNGLIAEYGMTKAVVAILARELLEQTGGDVIKISDEEISCAPDLLAWRDVPGRQVVISVER